MSRLTESPAWKALVKHQKEIAAVHMRDLFAQDPKRFERFSLRLGDVFFDYSKNRITAQTMSLLMDLARCADLNQHIDAMFAGEKINATEDRAVLHIALRNHSNRPIWVDGNNVMPQVNTVLAKMKSFSQAVRSGTWKGFSGRPLTDIVNIGIGGSDLGPKMACQALSFYKKKRLHIHFVSNVDGTDLTQTLEKISPDTTLFIVASKSFTTQETMTNAQSAKDWFLSSGANQSHVAKHFVALSTNTRAVSAFGIDPDNMFAFWDWVGGRYSLWSAVGLSIAIAVGMKNFEKLLAGAHRVDEHFRTTPFEKNIPVVMAVLGIWYIDFFHALSHAVLPYDAYLAKFPAYLQQGDMESNGKQVNWNGEEVDYATGPVIWGEPGTNGQHAFFQLLHQGSQMIPCDFLAAVHSLNPLGDHHTLLVANCFAQTQALMKGRNLEETRADLAASGISGKRLDLLAAAKTFPGNRPTNTILFNKLTPEALGSLIALYEHKIFVQGIIWQINSFDQMGVELGKKLAGAIIPELTSDDAITAHDGSTNGLINHFNRVRLQ
jgi:glucose-6-phosphate isomerase